MQAGHPTPSQCLNVVAVAFTLQCGTLAKPAAGRHANKRHGLAFGVVTAHLQQAINHTKPVRHGTTGAAHVITGTGIRDLEVVHGTLALGGCQQMNPGNGVEFEGRQGASALMQ